MTKLRFCLSFLCVFVLLAGALAQVQMDARRSSAAKVGILASCTTKQTPQLAQPDPFSPLSRDRSAFVPMKQPAVAGSGAAQ